MLNLAFGSHASLPLGMGCKLCLIGAVLSAAACSWVRPTTPSHEVLLLTEDRVSDCQKLGSTTVKTLSKVVVVSRSDDKMHNELVTLAKNEAVVMGGDTVAPLSPADGGQQVFGVYDCR